MTKNVHTEHCCKEHGCKYGDVNCPVVLGIDVQSFSCEDCDEGVGQMSDKNIPPAVAEFATVSYSDLLAIIAQRDATIVEQAAEIQSWKSLCGSRFDDILLMADRHAAEIAALKQPGAGDYQMEVEAEGWWNGSEDVYTWPIRISNWGARVECHGNTPADARVLALHVASLNASRVVVPEGKYSADDGWCKVPMELLEQCLEGFDDYWIENDGAECVAELRALLAQQEVQL